MKELYNKYFHIPKYGKIGKPVLCVRAAVMALSMILCLCAFSIGTYAYYTYTVSSEGNVIEAAEFGVDVTINDVPVVAANGVYELLPGSHTITVTPTGNATKGFVVIKVETPPMGVVLMIGDAGDGGEQIQSADADITSTGTYCTPQLFAADGTPLAATFTVDTGDAVTLTMEAYWGEQSNYPIGGTTLPDSVVTSASDPVQLMEEPVEEEQEMQEEEKQQEELPLDEQEENNGETEAAEEQDPVDDTAPEDTPGAEDSSDSEGESDIVDNASEIDDIPGDSGEGVSDPVPDDGGDAADTGETTETQTTDDTTEESVTT